MEKVAMTFGELPLCMGSRELLTASIQHLVGASLGQDNYTCTQNALRILDDLTGMYGAEPVTHADIAALKILQSSALLEQLKGVMPDLKFSKIRQTLLQLSSALPRDFEHYQSIKKATN